MKKDWIQRIDTITTLFNDHFESLSYDELNKKPDPETWSIAQNIEHLVLINNTYFTVFSEVKSGSLKLPFYGGIRFISSFFGNLILNAVEPERKKKGKTFGIWKPSSSQVPVEVLERFSKSQEELKQHILDLGKEIDNDVIVYTPVSKSIVLPLNTAIEIIVTHEMRHFNQAKEIQNIL